MVKRKELRDLLSRAAAFVDADQSGLTDRERVDLLEDLNSATEELKTDGATVVKEGDSIWVAYQHSPDGGVTVDEPVVGIFLNWGDAVVAVEKQTGMKFPDKGDEIQVQPSLLISIEPFPVQ